MPTNEFLRGLSEKVRSYGGKPLRIMEVCGTHTHENFRLGIRSMLPETIQLISGPGCPVCVTPSSYIDEALYLANKGVTVFSFGDLLRVPGEGGSLLQARALGAKINVAYSPVDAFHYALQHPQEQVVFLSVGFETTTPISCLAAQKASEAELCNFSLLTSNKTMTNAYFKLAGSADAFLYPGHVSVITGTEVYEMLREKGISGVVAGFTAQELLLALTVIIEKSRAGLPYAVNCYPSVVKAEGNPVARDLVDKMMEPCDAQWRGLGVIEGTGMKLKAQFADLDARVKYHIPPMKEAEPKGCRCGEILRGDAEPRQCPLYGKACTPENPRGACMVSSEGACAAYYKFGRT